MPAKSIGVGEEWEKTPRLALSQSDSLSPEHSRTEIPRMASAAVTVVRSTMVSPETETPRHVVPLPTLDLFQVRAHLPTIYHYRPTGDPDFFSPETLRRALAKTLVPFCVLAGRICSDAAAGGRPMLDCNAKGVLFVEARCDLTADEYGSFAPSLENRKLLVPSVDLAAGESEVPLVILQVTFFACGGVSLGTGVHHTVSDGVSSLHFINAWSDSARGIDIAVPPFLDRSLVSARPTPAISFFHPEFQPNPPAPAFAAKKPPAATAVLDLSAGQVAALKAAGNASGKSRYTTFEIISAHVWRCSCRARRLSDDAQTRIFTTIDGRSRFRPPFPPGYVGNVIFPTVASAAAGDLVAGGLEDATARIRRMVSRLDDEYLRSALDYLEVQEDVRKIGRWVGEFPASDLSIVSWTRLPIYDADFGWGMPAYMGPAMLLYAGLCYIMPSLVKDGAVRVMVALEEDFLDEFKRLFFDVGFVAC